MSSFPQPPSVPEAPFESRRFEAGGLEIRPLKGPSIDIPGEENGTLQDRFERWKAENGFPVASLPEFITWEFLVHRKKQIPGVDFVFQSPVAGGRTEFGGFVVDFYLVPKKYVWNIQGERWHIFFPKDRARDQLAKAILESQGITVLFLREDDILSRPELTFELAWEGRQLQYTEESL